MNQDATQHHLFRDIVGGVAILGGVGLGVHTAGRFLSKDTKNAIKTIAGNLTRRDTGEAERLVEGIKAAGWESHLGGATVRNKDNSVGWDIGKLRDIHQRLYQ